MLDSKHIVADRKVEKGQKLAKILLIIGLIINFIAFMDVRFLTMYRKIASFNIFFLVFILILSGKIKKKVSTNLFSILILTIYGTCTVLINSGGLGSIINYIYGFVIIIVFSQFCFTKKDFKILTLFLFLLNFYWVTKSKGYYNKVIYEGIHNINPNVVGYLILYTSMLICIFIGQLKYKFKKIIILFVLATSVYGIALLEVRGSLIPLIVFILLNYVIPKDFYRKKQKRIVYANFIIIMVGVLFPIVYLMMYKYGINIEISFINKNLYTGREVIWNSFFLTMEDTIKWLFGLGSRAELLGIGEKLDLHNNYLAIIANFGVIGFVGYFGFILKKIHFICTFKSLSDLKISLLIGFMCVLINGYFEATIYFAPIFFLLFIFLGIANAETEKELFNNEQI
ncbi:hypothetical protein SAMN02745248_01871 [Hathewaya proteolytica DSM 3090]|uniref:O-antigen ligase-related domain-containing protein n=1 Tax=Hathewaya proteolytica DSM 3090 TaxID=1121331 RepID=A0A1M6Q2A9_9CLOT|nr:O-antigen ligase family protein [Hathewaya proteolytica]SHK14369.1 hypothetical protein SAMN02745248_01871 [Hathewaya proteolytica DSM 3090]